MRWVGGRYIFHNEGHRTNATIGMLDLLLLDVSFTRYRVTRLPRSLLFGHFLTIDNIELVAVAKDDGSFRNFPSLQFIDVCGRVTFGSRLGNVETLQIDDYGLVIAELI